MVRSYTKAELLALTPDRYLAEGFCDAAGDARPELLTEYATAAANQLMQAELSPDELTFTIEAFRLALPLHEGAPAAQARGAVDEALATVTRMIRQPNNEGLIRWLEQCADHVGSADDLEAMEDHLDAVLRLYAVVAVFEPSDSASSSPPDPS